MTRDTKSAREIVMEIQRLEWEMLQIQRDATKPGYQVDVEKICLPIEGKIDALKWVLYGRWEERKAPVANKWRG